MDGAPAEVEVKFPVERLADTARRLEELGALVKAPRVLERNLRFDTPDGQLEREHKALRLRQDATTTLTFKGPSSFMDGIRARTEIEAKVEGYDGTRQLLEALGYVVTFEYEKYRTTYALAETSVMLDELPYGEFVEIEGDPGPIKAAAAQLGLRWEAAIQDSYLGLFEKLRVRLKLPFSSLTFENFSRHAARVRDLGIVPADA